MPSREDNIAVAKRYLGLGGTDSMAKEVSANETEEPSVVASILDGVAYVGDEIDKFTGAPVRRAVGVLQDGGSVSQAGLAAARQFGADDRSQVPSGTDIAVKAGVSNVRPQKGDLLLGNDFHSPRAGFTLPARDTGPSPAEVVGVFVEAGADITNLMPAMGMLAKSAKAAKSTKLGASVVSHTTEAFKKMDSAMVGLFSKTGSAFTGVGDKFIKNYVKNIDQINDMIKRMKAGGELSEGVFEEVKNFRRAVGDSIQKTRRLMNKDISQALQAAPTTQTIDIRNIVGRLNAAKKRINPALDPEGLGSIDELLDRIKAVSPKGRVNLQELQDIKEFFSIRAKSAFAKNGQIFINTGHAQRAARNALAEANQLMRRSAPKEILSANTKLAELHRIEEAMTRSLLNEGANPNAVLSAGAGVNTANRDVLKRIGRATGENFVKRADDIQTAKTFAEPNLLPQSAGGTTSTSRSIVAGGVGSFVGATPGLILGVAVTSPLALKIAINTGTLPRKLFRALSGSSVVNRKTLEHAFHVIGTQRGARIIESFEKAQSMKNVADDENKNAVGVQPGQ